MADYIWTYCREAVEMQNNQFSMKFGDNFKFVAGPSSRALSSFTLNYTTLCFFTSLQTVNGSKVWVPDRTKTPALNAFCLLDFYMDKQLNKIFTYNSPVMGLVNVRFKSVLKFPAGIEDGKGWLEPFTVELEECLI